MAVVHMLGSGHWTVAYVGLLGIDSQTSRVSWDWHVL